VSEHKPSIKIVRQHFDNKDQYFSLPYLCREVGVKKIEVEYQPVKPRPERFHFEEKLSGHMDPNKGGLMADPNKLQRTENEHALENDMGLKKRIEGFEGKRNELPYTSLGDKPYKYAEDSSNFFKEGGLIAGSSHPEKMEKKGAGNSKIVDYYATLDLSKATMKKGLTWKEKVKQEQLTEDKKAVNDLIAWYFFNKFKFL